MATQRGQGQRFFNAKAPAPIINIANRRSKRQPLQDGRKAGVFVAVPTVDGNVNFSIALSFARMMASNHIADCPFVFSCHIEPGKRPIDFARNSIVKVFMEESDADWLLMVDADQVIPENFFHLCMVTDADVVSGLTPVWVGNMDPEAMLRVNNYGIDQNHQIFNLPTPGQEMTQPYRVPVVGTGCIAIRRRVFAPKPHGVGMSPFYFTNLEDRRVMCGEDVNFSVECNRAGFILAVHPSVRFGHVKPIELWQVEQYYLARKAMEEKGLQTTDAQRLSIG